VNDNLVEVRGLRFRYPDGTLALDGVDFVLRRGETVALLGANGSGKTTFVLHLNGLLHGEGAVTVCGMRATKENFPRIRNLAGLVFQDSDNQLFMPSVIEDVAFGPLNGGHTPGDAEKIAREALAAVGMEAAAAKAPYHLSAGEKKRVAIAGVLAMRPELLILDEPTTFLDPPSRAGLVDLLRRLTQSKLLVTHDLGFADSLATRAVFFEKGRIVGEGTVPAIAGRFHWGTSLDYFR
jgi:cobalt/nickel transport system ATP-binding protein